MLINLFTVFAYSSKPPTGKLGRQKKKKSTASAPSDFAMGSKNLYARTYKEARETQASMHL